MPAEIFWLCCNPVSDRNQDSPFSKAHAVLLDPKATKFGRGAALCGARPARGWYMDLFIDLDLFGNKCKRCEKSAPRAGNGTGECGHSMTRRSR